MRPSAVVAAALCVAGLACSAATVPGDSTSKPTVASVTISPPSVSTQAGQTVQLSATAFDSAGNVLADRTPTWSSSDNAIASISSTGLLSGHASGNAMIHALIDGKEGTAPAVVTPIPIASISIAPAAPTIQQGATVQFSATPRDAQGNALSGRVITWGTSNASVATVNTSGLATSLAAGTSTISATSGGVTGQTLLTVTTTAPPPPPPVATVAVSLGSGSLTVGQTTQASAVLKDASGNVLTGRAVTWSSSNTSAATVNANGVVSAVAAGGANIVATSEGKTGQASVTVAVVPVASVTVSLTLSSLTTGQTTQATAVTKDASGNVLTGRTIAWSSSNTAVATVTAAGVVTAAGQGTANITATSETKSGSAQLTVNPASTSGDTLFVDRFETGALGDAGRWQDIVGSGASLVSAAAEGLTAPSGTKVLKLSGTGAALTHFVATGASSPYEHLYLSFKLLRTAAYQAANPGLRAGGIRGSTTQYGSFGVGYGTSGSCPDDPNNVNQQEFMFAYVFQDPAAWALRLYTQWLDELKLTTNPPTCGGGYALTAGNTPVATYSDLAFAPTVGAWHTYEVEVQVNAVGQANGWSRIWVDGVEKVAHVNVRYRTTAGLKLWAVTIDTGTMHGGELYVDDVVVGTNRVQ